MVERSVTLDAVFASLSDPTRRDILRRVAREELSVGEITQSYKLTFAAISKHLQVLEKANLIVKRREGKKHVVTLAPKPLAKAADYIRKYQELWEQRLDSLEEYLKTMK